ncbi:MAG: glycosyltransferase family A protein [Caldimicrobium sp.]
MRFSLVLGTYGRYTELERFLKSLKNQTYKNFELILCDQNQEGFLEKLLSEYSGDFEIIHLHSERGLSRARNAGLKIAKGDVIAFPDDDCLYPEDLLAKVKEILEAYPEVDGVSGRAISLDKGRMDQKFYSERTFLSEENVFFCVTSFTLFLRRKVIEAVGEFDESLGVGSGTPLGSGEEVDYVLRALGKGLKILYVPDIVVFHPSKDPEIEGYSRETLKRAEAYNRGYAYLLKRYHYPLGFKFKALLRPLLGAFYFGFKGNFRRSIYQFYKFLGRVKGLILH